MTRSAFRYVRRNPSLAVGITLLTVLALFVIIGNLLVDTEDARPLSAPTLRPPSQEYPFGTDRQGRDLLAVMVAGTPLTLRIGFVAGFGSASALCLPSSAHFTAASSTRSFAA